MKPKVDAQLRDDMEPQKRIQIVAKISREVYEEQPQEMKAKYKKMKEELQVKCKQTMDLLKDIIEGKLDEGMTPEDLAP